MGSTTPVQVYSEFSTGSILSFISSSFLMDQCNRGHRGCADEVGGHNPVLLFLLCPLSRSLSAALMYIHIKMKQTSMEVVSRVSCSLSPSLPPKLDSVFLFHVQSQLDSIPSFLGNPAKKRALHNSLCPLLEFSHFCRKPSSCSAASWQHFSTVWAETKNNALQLTCPGEGKARAPLITQDLRVSNESTDLLWRGRQ